MSNEVMYRPGTEADMPFVYKSWIRCYAKSPWAGAMQRKFLVAAIKATIPALLARDHCALTMACNPRDPDQIFGFVCFETDQTYPLLHFVYVKDKFRNMRIGSDLIAVARGPRKGVMVYTHKTRACSKLLKYAKYKPNLSRYDKKETHADHPPTQLRTH